MDDQLPLSTSMSFLELPIEMVDKIVSYLSYDQIAKIRAVNRFFNTICSDKLNKGFVQVEQFHNKCIKMVKSKLPRRESARKHHPLARHSDILMAIETRLSMLSMTFTKYIEGRYCCFIPGKVLDEAFKVLRIVHYSSLYMVSNPPHYSSNLARPHDFLQEYRDISSMAMEHFDDKILPAIKEKIRLENPRLLYYKNKPGKSSMLGVQSVKVPNSRNIPMSFMGCARIFPVPPEIADSKAAIPATISVPTLKLQSLLHHTKVRCSNTRKTVFMINRNVKRLSKKMDTQSDALKQKLAEQDAIIKHLRRELRRTRNAVSVMSKDLNRLKMEQSPSQDQSPASNPVCSKLSVTVTSSISIPAEENLANAPDCKGIKRKREVIDAVVNTR